MPIKTNTVPGAPCWAEVSSSNVEQSIEFYSGVFYWEPTAGDHELGDGYITFYRSSRRIAGLRKRRPDAVGPDSWVSFLMTPDAMDTARAVEEAGGSNPLIALSVPGQGVLGRVVDPGGASVGLWQPEEHTGYGIFGQNAAVMWHELHTREFAESVAFYERAFGWTMESMGDSDDFRYSRFVADGMPQAGIMDAARYLRPGVGSNWQVYIGATDVDHILGRVLQHGGHVVEAPEDTPYGRLAGVTDSTGAFFKIVSASE